MSSRLTFLLIHLYTLLFFTHSHTHTLFTHFAHSLTEAAINFPSYVSAQQKRERKNRRLEEIAFGHNCLFHCVCVLFSIDLARIIVKLRHPYRDHHVNKSQKITIFFEHFKSGANSYMPKTIFQRNRQKFQKREKIVILQSNRDDDDNKERLQYKTN